MQAVLNSDISKDTISNTAVSMARNLTVNMTTNLNSNFNINFKNIQEQLDYLLACVDLKTKNDIENKIVAMGTKVVDALISKLKTLSGIKRGIVAMSLIRIGDAAKAPLKEFALCNSDCRWMADYLLSEI